METPKVQLVKLSALLRELHRRLLTKEAKKLEAEMGRPIPPYELLNLSLNDSRLAWLRRMSALIVRIDTTIDEVETPGALEITTIGGEVSDLIEKADDANVFWPKYTGYLAEDAEIILQHSEIKDQLATLRRMNQN